MKMPISDFRYCFFYFIVPYLLFNIQKKNQEPSLFSRTFVRKSMNKRQRLNSRIPNVLYFGPEKCLKEVIITCETCFEKASLVHFFLLFEIYDHVSKGKFGPHSNCSKRQVCSIFGENSGPNLPFSNSLNHVWEMFSKRQNWSRFFSEYGANLPFRAI